MGVLVTGGAGYIGSHIVLELLDRGERVLVVDDLSTGKRSAVPESASFVEGNVGDDELLSSLIRRHQIDAIIHCAGSVVVPESIINPLKYYQNNTMHSRALIESAVRSGVRDFVFSSTAAVYGIPASIPVDEDAPLMPISPYGSSKVMTEMMLRDVANAHSLRYLALRYFNVAGADPLGRAGQSSPSSTHLIKVACEAAVGMREYVEIYGRDYPTLDGTCIRDYIHVTDLARAHLSALNYLRNGGQSRALNCGYGRGHSVLQVIEAVKKQSPRDFDVRYAARRSGDPEQLVANNARIRACLNWQPELDNLDLIVAHALSWENRIALHRSPSQ